MLLPSTDATQPSGQLLHGLGLVDRTNVLYLDCNLDTGSSILLIHPGTLPKIDGLRLWGRGIACKWTYGISTRLCAMNSVNLLPSPSTHRSRIVIPYMCVLKTNSVTGLCVCV